MQTDLPFLISLTQVPQVGCIQARILLRHFGTAEAVFKSSPGLLESIEGIGEIRARSIKSFHDFSLAEREVSFIRRYGIRVLVIGDTAYPKRLLSAHDPPLLLFYKGDADLNPDRCISVVGTRRNSEYGKQMAEKLITDLTPYNVTIVSGLAFGIDAIAHRQALKQNLPTLAVLAHGLSSLYPPEHSQLSRQMLKQGGLITEYLSYVKADKHRFPARNRIVAGMSDCTVVIETAVKGGSMITADLANGYNREVFALPGRVNDSKSAGCNWLIRKNQATLLESADELARWMGWEEKIKRGEISQIDLFAGLHEPEMRILALLKEREQMHIDVINATSGFPNSQNATAILELELKGLINSMPGRIYRIKTPNA